MNFFMEVAKLRAARLLWAKLVKPFAAQGPQVAVAAHPLPDLRLVADRAGRLQQRHAHLHRGAWPRPTATRSRCTPTRSTRRWRCRPTSRPASPATRSCSSAAGDRDHADDRSLGRQLLCRAADLRPGPAAPGRTSRRSRPRAGWRGRSSRASPSCGSRRRRPAPRRASTAASRRWSASTSTARPRPRTSRCSRSTTRPCAPRQIEKLERLRADRDELACRRALDALTRCAETGEGNLLDLVGAGGPGPGHGRRDHLRAGEGLGPPRGRDPLDRRRLRPGGG